MSTEIFAPGDLIEALDLNGKVWGRGIVTKVVANGLMLVIEFEDTVPATNRRVDTVSPTNCRKINQESTS